jgi:hypothetical protein
MLASFAIQPNPAGVLMDSRTFAYKLLPKYDRVLGKGSHGHESAHPSARERMDKVPRYRPENLLRYLKAAGVPVP